LDDLVVVGVRHYGCDALACFGYRFLNRRGVSFIGAVQRDGHIRIPPGQKHWHGATATTSMTHIAIQEQLDGKAVEWMEKVCDEQYRK
jgi:hypothetical protein